MAHLSDEEETEAVDTTIKLQEEFAAYKQKLTEHPNAQMFECIVPNEVHRYHYVNKDNVFAIVMNSSRHFIKYIPNIKFH